MNDAAASERGFERGERRRQLVDAPRDLGLRRHVHIVFGKVDAGFEQRDQFNERLLDGRNAMAERATHLAGGLARLRERLRVDEVAHRFGLREIEPAGQKRPLRELSGLGQPRAELERAAQQQFEHHRRPVRGNLYQIFRGVGVWRGKESHQRLVDWRRPRRLSASSTSANRARACSSG